MVDDEDQAEIDELVRQAIFLATADERYWSLGIKPAVMRGRAKNALIQGETDISRLVGIALGEQVVVQFPFYGQLLERMKPPPPTHRSWFDFTPS
jgi:hypothetical protein